MRRLSMGAAAAAVLALGIGCGVMPAEAGTISYDQNIPAYAGGVYYGSGNPNGGYTLSDNGSFTIGLSIKGRQNPNVIDTPDNVYAVPAGAEPGAPTYAWWNWQRAIYCDFSASCTPGTIQTLLGDSQFVFTDVTSGAHAAYAALAIAVDDDTWTGFSKSNLLNPFIVSAENSENPLHSLFIPGYDMNANDLYRIDWNVYGDKTFTGPALNTLSVFACVGNASCSTAVPEAPTGLLFLGGGLAALGLFAFGRKKGTPAAPTAAV